MKDVRELEELWSAVDGYVAALLVGHDAALEAALEASAAAGLPAIQVSATQGKLLHLLVRMQGARNVLEIGTLGGYSAIWLARGLATGGRLITLERDPRYAELARSNIARADLTGVIDVRVGLALETLRQLKSERQEPFDLIFIDADKVSYPDYLEWAVRLSRRGSVIVADNVVRRGEITDGDSADPSVRAMRRFNELLASEPRLSATEIQTVASKGYDGFAIALVVAD